MPNISTMGLDAAINKGFEKAQKNAAEIATSSANGQPVSILDIDNPYGYFQGQMKTFALEEKDLQGVKTVVDTQVKALESIHETFNTLYARAQSDDVRDNVANAQIVFKSQCRQALQAMQTALSADVMGGKIFNGNVTNQGPVENLANFRTGDNTNVDYGYTTSTATEESSITLTLDPSSKKPLTIKPQDSGIERVAKFLALGAAGYIDNAKIVGGQAETNLAALQLERGMMLQLVNSTQEDLTKQAQSNQAKQNEVNGKNIEKMIEDIRDLSLATMAQTASSSISDSIQMARKSFFNR